MGKENSQSFKYANRNVQCVTCQNEGCRGVISKTISHGKILRIIFSQSFEFNNYLIGHLLPKVTKVFNFLQLKNIFFFTSNVCQEVVVFFD